MPESEQAVLVERLALRKACASLADLDSPAEQAAAAARDHGASLLTSSDVEGAVPLLERASSLVERAGDDPGTAAANVLGLAHLAADNASAAVAVLRRALGFVPRSTRPADYAMGKANLALAVASSTPPVRAQAQELLARLPGRAPDDLLEVLDEQDRASWAPLVREDVLRVADSPAGERRVLVAGLLDGVLTRPAASYDLAESLLQVVLELPPRWYELLVAAIVDAVAGRPEQDVARLQAVFGSAMARFALPAVAAAGRQPQRGGRGGGAAGDVAMTGDLDAAALTGLHPAPAPGADARARGLALRRRTARTARRDRPAGRAPGVAGRGARRRRYAAGPARRLRRVRPAAHRVGQPDGARRARSAPAGPPC